MTGNTEVEALAKKLAMALESDEEPYIFTASEVQEIQNLLGFFAKVKALGWFGKWLFYAVIAAGTILLNWDRIMEKFQ